MRGDLDAWTKRTFEVYAAHSVLKAGGRIEVPLQEIMETAKELTPEGGSVLAYFDTAAPIDPDAPGSARLILEWLSDEDHTRIYNRISEHDAGEHVTPWTDCPICEDDDRQGVYRKAVGR